MPVLFRVTICTTRDGARTKRPAADDVRVRSLVYNDSATRCSKARVLHVASVYSDFQLSEVKTQSCCLHATLFFMRTGATIL